MIFVNQFVLRGKKKKEEVHTAIWDRHIITAVHESILAHGPQNSESQKNERKIPPLLWPRWAHRSAECGVILTGRVHTIRRLPRCRNCRLRRIISAHAWKYEIVSGLSQVVGELEVASAHKGEFVSAMDSSRLPHIHNFPTPHYPLTLLLYSFSLSSPNGKTETIRKLRPPAFQQGQKK